jgi:SAM-dependent methyltransferase
MHPMEPDYIRVNRALWDEKTRHHISSAFYHMDDDAFLNGRSSLNDIELQLLGDLRGKELLHLQCHFGQDTLSLARLGARATGVDFSEVAIGKARELNEQLNLNAEFICTDIYELPAKLDREFDIVFASYGTIGWLPDMQRWAQVVARYLKPGGRFVFVEFHPVVWMFNHDFTGIEYSYFNKEAIIETATTTYADRSAAINKQEIGWNHDLSEVMQALLDAGLRIDAFNEHDASPYNCFKNMVEVVPGSFQIAGLEGKLPLVYSLVASRK